MIVLYPEAGMHISLPKASGPSSAVVDCLITDVSVSLGFCNNKKQHLAKVWGALIQFTPIPQLTEPNPLPNADTFDPFLNYLKLLALVSSGNECHRFCRFCRL